MAQPYYLNTNEPAFEYNNSTRNWEPVSFSHLDKEHRAILRDLAKFADKITANIRDKKETDPKSMFKSYPCIRFYVDAPANEFGDGKKYPIELRPYAHKYFAVVDPNPKAVLPDPEASKEDVKVETESRQQQASLRKIAMKLARL